MKIAEVTGQVVSSIKHPIYNGNPLLLCQPILPDGTADGIEFIGVDRVQAGPGDRVLYVDEGNSARTVLGDDTAPVRAVLVGIIDRVDIY